MSNVKANREDSCRSQKKTKMEKNPKVKDCIPLEVFLQNIFFCFNSVISCC